MIKSRNALVSALLLDILTSRSGAALPQGYFHSSDQVTERWSAVLGNDGTAVGPGNGAFMSLDGQTLAVINQACTVTAYDPSTGAEQWTYAPADTSLQCTTGGLWFTNFYVAFSPVGVTR